MNRRRALQIAGAAALAAPVGTALAQSASKPATASGGPGPGKHQIVPLPFDAKKLQGLSERMLVSHRRYDRALIAGRALRS
jgi:hypothetical protein